MKIHVGTLPVLFAILFSTIITGCVNYQANYLQPLFGIAAKDGERMQVNDGLIEIPDYAPSISQGYFAAPTEATPGDFHPDHPGIDIVAVVGTPVLAAAPGKVINSRYDPMYGNQIAIQHKHTPDMKTSYFHLSSRLVEKGDQVKAGQPIESLGSTGILAAFRHLHFEVRSLHNKLWHPHNPHLFWKDGIGKVTCYSNDVDHKIANTQFYITYPVACKNSGSLH